MTTNFFRTAAIAALASVTLAGAADATNLKPKFNAKTGVVRIVKAGNAAIPNTIATVECAGDCPEVTPAMIAMGPELEGANKLLIPVPPMGANQASHSHQISFYDDLFFPKGTAVFTVCVDAKNHVAETSETDNCVRVKRRSQGAVVAIPVPKPVLKARQ